MQKSCIPCTSQAWNNQHDSPNSYCSSGSWTQRPNLLSRRWSPYPPHVSVIHMSDQMSWTEIILHISSVKCTNHPPTERNSISSSPAVFLNLLICFRLPTNIKKIIKIEIQQKPTPTCVGLDALLVLLYRNLVVSYCATEINQWHTSYFPSRCCIAWSNSCIPRYLR